MVQPSSRPHFSFAIITSCGNQITPAKHEDNLEMKVQNPDEFQEDRVVIRVVQSENILLRFLRRGHADDGCSCNHRAVPPSEDYVVDLGPSRKKLGLDDMVLFMSVITI